ncbi:hypothetical protein L9F63_018714, partial [Diploptera punctata]
SPFSPRYAIWRWTGNVNRQLVMPTRRDRLVMSLPCSIPAMSTSICQMAEDAHYYPLHDCVFSGDVRRLSSLLRVNDVTKKDKHGNTALHLAVMLGRKECVHLLLAHGAPVKVKNLAGWSPLAEAISYGDRQTISSLVRKLKQQAREQMEERRPNLVSALNQMGDFYMELKWDFQSWVPLVSRILPSDICRIHKCGSSIRLDTTLVDFNDMRWERGDISFLFNGDRKPNLSLTVLDNKAELYQRVRYEETEVEIEDEVDILMSSDIMAAQMSTKSITFTRAQTGWIFREDRKNCSIGKHIIPIFSCFHNSQFFIMPPGTLLVTGVMSIGRNSSSSLCWWTDEPLDQFSLLIG